MPTVRDCLAKARFPERLRFGICWQHDPGEEIPGWFSGDRFRILDVDWRESRGACWARSQIMELWDGEEWFLQLDSHHRFSPDWDVKLLEQANATGTGAFVLSTYAAPFRPGHEDEAEALLTRMEFDRFAGDGLVLTRPGFITPPGRPLRARFLSAHFLFAPGRFVEDVPYDPDLYFTGEETTLAVRAFTAGYDLFHPGEHILWHEYSRAYRPKHWDDHTAENAVEVAWWERDASSRAKVSRLFAGPVVGRHGLGTERTLADYEAYAGLSFRHRRAQDYTLQHGEPPNPPAPPDWAERVDDHWVEIDVKIADLPPGALDDATFWYVGLHDETGRELYRRDAEPAELAAAAQGGRVRLVRQFRSQHQPATWTVLPHTAAAGWLERLSGDLPSRSAPHGLGPATWYPARAAGVELLPCPDGYHVRAGPDGGLTHVVNAVGALLLEMANGCHSVLEISRLLRKYCPGNTDVSDIESFYKSAHAAGLIEER